MRARRLVVALGAVAGVCAGGSLMAHPRAAADADPPTGPGAPPEVRALAILAAAPRAPAKPAVDRSAGFWSATCHASAGETPPDHAAARALVHARAEAEARRLLHRAADDALASERAHPWVADRVHGVVAKRGRVLGRRTLPSGAALVRFGVPLEALVNASGRTLAAALPWAPTP